MHELAQYIDPCEDVQEAWISPEGYSVESRNSLDDPTTWKVVIAIPRRHFNYTFLRRLWEDRLKPDAIVRVREQDQIVRTQHSRSGTVIEWQLKNQRIPPWDWIAYTAQHASLDLALYTRYHDTPPPFNPVRNDRLVVPHVAELYAPSGHVNISRIYMPIRYDAPLNPPEEGVNFNLYPGEGSASSDLPVGPPPLIRQLAYSHEGLTLVLPDVDDVPDDLPLARGGYSRASHFREAIARYDPAVVEVAHRIIPE